MAIIFHIDVNSAFLSWSAAEKLRCGSTLDLRTIPSIIGGDEKSRHGVVLAKSTPAKEYGIHTGEPVAAALKKCPILVMEPPDHTLYRQRSQELMELLGTYTSDLEQLSIDECFLDFTPIAHRFDSPLQAAEQIKNRIREQLGFTVNIGISSNRLLAKMASDFQKPDRIHTLFPQEIAAKMWPLPVEDLYMVGRSSASRLHELGIHTIGDLARTDQDFLISHFKSHGRQMWNYANGIDSSVICPQERDRKGIGNSITLAADVHTAREAHRVLLQLSETVSGRLRKSGVAAQSVTVEIKYSDFTCCSHQSPVNLPVNSSQALYQTACRLFDELWNGAPVRLLGIRTTKLQDEHAPVQLSLFDLDWPAAEPENNGKTYRSENVTDSGKTSCSENAANSGKPNCSGNMKDSGKPNCSGNVKDSGKERRIQKENDFRSATASLEKQRKLDAAMDAIRRRYGSDAVVRGSFLEKKR